MVDIKREDITLQDRTKGISADEFAGGSYFYSEGISSGYSSKGFELGNYASKQLLNKREGGKAVAMTPIGPYGFSVFTADGCIEMEVSYSGEKKGAYYRTIPQSTDLNYYNGLGYGGKFIGIKENYVDIISFNNLFSNTDLVTNPTFSGGGTGWTMGAGWTATDNGAEHTTGNTGTLQMTPSGSYSTADAFRCALHITGWTAGTLSVTLGNNSVSFDSHEEGWYVASLKGATTTKLVITPTSSFNGTIAEVNLNQYDMSNIYTATIYGGALSDTHPALIWEGELYIASGHYVNIINLSDNGVTYKELIDKNFKIVAMNQQAGNIILWATDGHDSRQYYWNGVDAVATEVIEWKGLIIQCATGTETISYVLTTSGATSGMVDGYEYRLYAVSGYQRSLIATKGYQYRSDDYLDAPHYNANKKFDFNDVTNDKGMTIFLDSLYIPGCDGVYKYGYDIPGLRSAWTKPVVYPNGATDIILGQGGHYLGMCYYVDNGNYLGKVDNRLYTPYGYLVTDSIYRDKLSTRKALEKIKIGYKTVASTVGNIKVYAIVDDTYFWRFRPTTTPTNRPSVGDVYEVANDAKAEVIAVNETEGVITFRTTEDKGSYANLANTTLTKVSGTGDDSITVGYNYDNMCLIKTIESENQEYNSDLIFGKDFVNTYLPFRHKIQFVIELSSNNYVLSPEIFEISMNSDITDITL